MISSLLYVLWRVCVRNRHSRTGHWKRKGKFYACLLCSFSCLGALLGFRDCQYLSCFRDCQYLSCFRDCQYLSCFRDCQYLSCFRDCQYLSCFRDCQYLSCFLRSLQVKQCWRNGETLKGNELTSVGWVQKAEVGQMFYTWTEKKTRMFFVKTELELERDTRGSYSGVPDYSNLRGCYAVPTGK